MMNGKVLIDEQIKKVHATRSALKSILLSLSIWFILSFGMSMLVHKFTKKVGRRPPQNVGKARLFRL